MSSSLVRLFLNALRNQKSDIIPSMYRDCNTYSIVEINDALNKAWDVYKSDIDYQNNDKIGRGYIYYTDVNNRETKKYGLVFGTLQINN